MAGKNLIDLVDCNVETGVITWKTTRNGRHGKSVAGEVVGGASGKGYLRVSLFGKSYLQHHIVWLAAHGELPVLDIDHINGIRADNRIANLRETTRAVNMQNLRRAHVDSASQLLGTYFDKRRGRWQASICKAGRNRFLGYFDTAEAAAQAYLTAKRSIHREGCTI